MFSPKNKAAEVHIRFSSSGVLHQEDGPPEYLTLKASGAYFQRRQWQPTPVLMPGISHGRRSLVGFSLWGRTKSAINNPQGAQRPQLAQSVQRCGTYPGEDWQMDFTQMPVSQGYKCLLVIIDTFTGWIEGFPTQTEKAEDVAKNCSMKSF